MGCLQCIVLDLIGSAISSMLSYWRPQSKLVVVLNRLPAWQVSPFLTWTCVPAGRDPLRGKMSPVVHLGHGNGSFVNLLPMAPLSTLYRGQWLVYMFGSQRHLCWGLASSQSRHQPAAALAWGKQFLLLYISRFIAYSSLHTHLLVFTLSFWQFIVSVW